MHPRVALATYIKKPDLTDDDRPLIPALAACGISAVPARWDDPAAQWRELDAVIIRSCWDYHLRLREFDAWLASLDQARVPSINSASVVRWNMHKRYLRELEAQGFTIPQTVWLDAGDKRTLSSIVRETGWDSVIVKPAVSASATDTWMARMSEVDALERRFHELTSRADVMVQRCLPEIVTEGEWSVIYIDGRLSHSAIKRPAAGDFRVQSEFGGSGIAADPPPPVVRATQAIAEALPPGWLFARIDGVQRGEEFILMEVECIEPDLFFRLRPESRHELAGAVRRLVNVR